MCVHAQVEDELCRTLAASWTRIMDFFRHCDTNNDGEVSRGEFVIGVISLKLSNDRKVVTSLFDSLDVDCSGTLSFGELHARLRKRAKPKSDYVPDRNMRCLMLPTIMPKLHPERRSVARNVTNEGDELAASSAGISFALPALIQAPMRRAIAAPRLRLRTVAAAPASAAVTSVLTSMPALSLPDANPVRKAAAPPQVPPDAAVPIAEANAAATAAASVQPAQGEIVGLAGGERKRRSIEPPKVNAVSARSRSGRAPPPPSLLPKIGLTRSRSAVSSAGSGSDALASTAGGHGLPRYPMARELRPVYESSSLHAGVYHDAASIVPSDAVDPQSYVGAANMLHASKTAEEINHIEDSAAPHAAGVQDEAAWCDRPLVLAVPSGGMAAAKCESRGLSRRVQQHRKNKVRQWQRQRYAAALPPPSCWEVTFSD